jgi:putative acetyltransferase
MPETLKTKHSNRAMDIEIRKERPGDEAAVRAVNDEAFGRKLEGRVVEALRVNGASKLSLVATRNDQIIGHIMYSPATIDGRIEGAALGPMAVLPDAQGQGIGSRLIEFGNNHLKESGCPFIVVLGHAGYYRRFGFQPASTRGIGCEWDVPEEAFMILALDENSLNDVTGTAKYRHEFSTIT